MNCKKMGRLLLNLRKEKNMTQKELAEALHLSDRTISKWERGQGCPDVSLLPALSALYGVHIEKLLEGDLAPNMQDGGNMNRCKFYSCPTCGNVLFSTGASEISCCGRRLEPLDVREEEGHALRIEDLDDELYVSVAHEMSKEHYLPFIACVAFDRVTLVKLYPEQDAACRFPKLFGGKFYVCCNRHGLLGGKKHTPGCSVK